MMKMIEILDEYSESAGESTGDIWDEERVAIAFRDRGLDPSLYYWADVHYSDGQYWIIFWKKTYGDCMRNIDIFDMDVEDERTLETYLDGLDGESFWPDKATQVLLLNDEIEQYEYEDKLREMKDRAGYILARADFWYQTIIGQEIPGPIMSQRIVEIEERV